MPQALILDSGGVRTRSTGFVEMTPEGEPRSKQIVFEGGRWLQKDLASGSEIMIITPNEMLSTDASEHIFYNYEKNQTPPLRNEVVYELFYPVPRCQDYSKFN